MRFKKMVAATPLWLDYYYDIFNLEAREAAIITKDFSIKNYLSLGLVKKTSFIFFLKIDYS